ncbi:DUF948 domain-containing protein [Sporosarcina jiandibaonis]|uniref:DUF948 domain-containing protein n=1 Tax=Sporosarcina jiandibaonis TaxID=2715535 RepID=UPI0015559CC1|nr:DUF948 domain-containing protein [Sporosarcina jiandibaonis]
MLVNIGVFLIAIAFLLVAIYVAKLLLRTSAIISTLGSTVSDVEGKLDKMITEMEATIVEMNSTAIDVEHKLASTNGLFMAIKDIGDTTSTVSGVSESWTDQYVTDESLAGTRPFIRAIQFGEFSFELVRSWKKGKQASL